MNEKGHQPKGKILDSKNPPQGGSGVKEKSKSTREYEDQIWELEKQVTDLQTEINKKGHYRIESKTKPSTSRIEQSINLTSKDQKYFSRRDVHIIVGFAVDFPIGELAKKWKMKYAEIEAILRAWLNTKD